LRAAFVASLFCGSFSPVDLRAVCLVRAMVRCVVAVSVLDVMRQCVDVTEFGGGEKILCLRPLFSGLKFIIHL
jgi:hypothetical protein